MAMSIEGMLDEARDHVAEVSVSVMTRAGSPSWWCMPSFWFKQRKSSSGAEESQDWISVG